MKILITGATGLVGSALIEELTRAGHEMLCLSRGKTADIRWDHATYDIESPDQLERLDAVIHLAGEPIMGRWTAAKKRRIFESRVLSTSKLADTLSQLKDKPSTFICASAVGYYGNRDADLLTEDSAAGTGFLADVCQAWEAAAEPARQAGIRTVHLRFGMLLSPKGGALKTMLPPFKMGLGGRIGPGTQYVSWASLDDAVKIIMHTLQTSSLEGPVNVTTPTPVTNLEFTRALGKALRRPTPFPVPAWLLLVVMGQMADELLLASQQVIPQKLTESGYTFQHTKLEEIFRAILQPVPKPLQKSEHAGFGAKV